MSLLIRWTFGPCQGDLGRRLLARSVSAAKRLYPEARRVVVANSGAKAGAVDAQVITTGGVDDLPLPSNTAWKFYPPRLHPNGHELFIDNDIVLTAAPPAIDEWLRTEDLLAYEGRHRLFGRCKLATNVPATNSGIIGLPPEYDFHRKLSKACRQYGIDAWEDHFDDQGIWAAIARKASLRVRQIEVPCLEPTDPHRRGTHGVHFVGANRGEHRWAEEFLRTKHA